MVKINEDERIDYLPDGKLKIIQSPDVFSFSIDAVLLAKFCYVPIQKGQIVDLCSGNGVVPLLLSERSRAKIIGVEIQERLFDMAIRSSQLNDLDGQLQFFLRDLKEAHEIFGYGQFDLVTCNPPYFKTISEKEWNKNEHLAIARHEIHCSLEDVIRVSSNLLKQKGKVAIVHRPERLIEMVNLMKQYRIEPKRIQLVYPREGAEANIVLVEGSKDGQTGVTFLPPIFVYNKDNSYTDQFKGIYYGEYT